jgi:hypothetical protein
MWRGPRVPSVVGMLPRLLRVAVLVVAALLVGVTPAAAHGANDVADVQLAQTIAGVELTLVIRQAMQVPGPLQVDVVAHHPVPDLELTLAVDAVPGIVTVPLSSGRAGIHPALLRVEATGQHELELRAGGEVSVLPFRVLLPRGARWERLVYGGFAAAAVLLIGALLAGGLGRRWPAVVLGGGAAGALVVALTVGVMSVQLPAAVPEGAPAAAPPGSGPLGRPYVQALVATAPGAPAVGEPFQLTLELLDGSTGRPVDDLVVHHAALAHAVVTSTDGGFFQHVHPRRTATGRLAVGLTADRPGVHVVAVEIERADSGGQLVTARFTVGGTAAAMAPEAGGPGAVVVVMSPARPVAGRPTTLTVDAGADDLQPWLGMAGHLIVRDADGDVLGHVHELGSMLAPTQQAPDETVAVHGPLLQFTFTFPEPGRWLAWVQYARDFRITTVPLVVTVHEQEAAG